MVENILYLQEQGWALPPDVDLRKYWWETLREAVEAKDPVLFGDLKNMLD